MTSKEKVISFAKECGGVVAISWIDNSKREYDAERAARLCSVPRIAACLLGAECSNKQLEAMLNNLIDGND